mmetsp:Transcript_64731/g.180117  ORF Transcript_64731/g.180117 Transcript_64731/m.180117 type:complete len:127 (-) Transcript_64731:1557-1937(-)
MPTPQDAELSPPPVPPLPASAEGRCWRVAADSDTLSCLVLGNRPGCTALFRDRWFVPPPEAGVPPDPAATGGFAAERCIRDEVMDRALTVEVCNRLLRGPPEGGVVEWLFPRNRAVLLPPVPDLAL